MDTLLGSQHRKWHATDWTAAAVSGLAAGAVLMVLDLIWSSIFSPDGPWRTSHMIAPIFAGGAPRTSGYEFSLGVVAISLATHYVVGILFGLVVAWIMAQLGLDAKPGRALVAGAILGAVLYLINFVILAASFFPWLTDMRGADTFAAHLVFGMVAAVLYCRLNRLGTQ